MDAQARDARASRPSRHRPSVKPLPTRLTIPADPHANASQQEEEEMPLPYVPLEELLKHGVAAGDIKKLNEAGIHTANALMQTSKRKLIQIKGLSEAKVEKIYEAGEKVAPVHAFQSGKFLLDHRQANLFRLTTGCADFDKMLGGGIETKSITEVYGEYRVGKSQLCLTLAVTAQLPRGDRRRRGPRAHPRHGGHLPPRAHPGDRPALRPQRRGRAEQHPRLARELRPAHRPGNGAPGPARHGTPVPACAGPHARPPGELAQEGRGDARVGGVPAARRRLDHRALPLRVLRPRRAGRAAAAAGRGAGHAQEDGRGGARRPVVAQPQLHRPAPPRQPPPSPPRPRRHPLPKRAPRPSTPLRARGARGALAAPAQRHACAHVAPRSSTSRWCSPTRSAQTPARWLRAPPRRFELHSRLAAALVLTPTRLSRPARAGSCPTRRRRSAATSSRTPRTRASRCARARATAASARSPTRRGAPRARRCT